MALGRYPSRWVLVSVGTGASQQQTLLITALREAHEELLPPLSQIRLHQQHEVEALLQRPPQQCWVKRAPLSTDTVTFLAVLWPNLSTITPVENRRSKSSLTKRRKPSTTAATNKYPVTTVFSIALEVFSRSQSGRGLFVSLTDLVQAKLQCSFGRRDGGTVPVLNLTISSGTYRLRDRLFFSKQRPDLYRWRNRKQILPVVYERQGSRWSSIRSLLVVMRTVASSRLSIGSK
jgi:hypothetical protein